MHNDLAQMKLLKQEAEICEEELTKACDKAAALCTHAGSERDKTTRIYLQLLSHIPQLLVGAEGREE